MEIPSKPDTGLPRIPYLWVLCVCVCVYVCVCAEPLYTNNAIFMHNTKIQ